MSGIAGKTVIVTGAGGGVGRATSVLLATREAKLALIDNDAAGLAETQALLREMGNSAVVRLGDITEAETLERLVDDATTAFQGIDAVCNIAGILGPGALDDISAAQFDRVMNVNCRAQMILIQKALPALRASRRASIVNVSSVGASVALPHMSIYCASKAAVLGMTRALAAELAPAIRCNSVCPGGIDSPMSQGLLAPLSAKERADILPKLIGRQLLKRFALPEEIAHVIAFLVSDESSFLTGAAVPVDGGHTAW